MKAREDVLMEISGVQKHLSEEKKTQDDFRRAALDEDETEDEGVMVSDDNQSDLQSISGRLENLECLGGKRRRENPKNSTTPDEFSNRPLRSGLELGFPRTTAYGLSANFFYFFLYYPTSSLGLHAFEFPKCLKTFINY